MNFEEWLLLIHNLVFADMSIVEQAMYKDEYNEAVEEGGITALDFN